MKKIIIVKWLGIVLFVVYSVLLIIDFVFDFLGDWKIITFSIILAIISINMIAKGVIIKSSSTLWFAVSLILFAITIAIFDIKNIDPKQYYFIFSIIPIISSIINLAIFENLIYIKVIILNISIAIPVFVWYFWDFKFIINLIISVLSVIIGIVISRFINLNKENG